MIQYDDNQHYLLFFKQDIRVQCCSTRKLAVMTCSGAQSARPEIHVLRNGHSAHLDGLLDSAGHVVVEEAHELHGVSQVAAYLLLA